MPRSGVASPPPRRRRDVGDAHSLERRLGRFDAAIVVSNVIGGGIFFVPILVAQFVGNARANAWMTRAVRRHRDFSDPL